MLSPSMGKFRCIVAGVVVSLAPMKDRIVEVKAFRLGRLVVGVDVRENEDSKSTFNGDPSRC